MTLELAPKDRELLQHLEEELWREATRFDAVRMNEVISADFFEFGRSGCVYGRTEILSAAPGPIDARLPLEDFQVRLIAADVAHVTYNSVLRRDGAYEFARRSSIWTRASGGWVIRFHQGTPYQPNG